MGYGLEARVRVLRGELAEAMQNGAGHKGFAIAICCCAVLVLLVLLPLFAGPVSTLSEGVAAS
jgi:hypothetical protein